ncbi:dihydroorotase [Ligilactobacillus hohenheimensis]|uniref:dihydroorotase n=1 Tax=Ligilactobacillus hohenheimensis TaxID=2991832 RepID=UPI0024B90CB0|nr:dihydroorotase [Ligilactobacillus hohenheimensis]
MNILIKDGNVFHNNQITQQDILVSDGRIRAIGRDLDALGEKVDRTINAAGKLVAPGLVDVHVHYREPGQTYKETIKTGSQAAAHGGFTTVCAMPNVDPAPDTPEKLRNMEKLNAQDGVVHIYQYATITKNRTSEEPVDYQALKDAGAIGFSNDGSGIQTAGAMMTAMEGIAATGLPLAAHVEDESLKLDGVMNAGDRAAKLGLPGIPGVAESSQVARDLLLAQATGVHYHICHVSTKESVALVRWAKQQGIPVTCEAAPHHMLLTEDDVTADNPNFKMNPPLRSEADRQAVIDGLLDGTIDMIATDHAPHSKEEKTGDLRHAAFGITGSETAFSTLYTRYVRTGVFTLAQLLNWLSRRPAELFHLDQAGTLMPGQPADIAIFDLEHPHVLSAGEYYSKGTNTPFTGHRVYGTTVLTMVAGQVVYEQKED